MSKTMDEVIAHAREVALEQSSIATELSLAGTDASECIKCKQEHEQLAEWLEELKDYRDKNKMVVRVDAENMDSIKDKFEKLSKYAEIQYNKAIDDFAEKLKAECREHYVDCDPYFGGIIDSILYEDDINEIAERLKAGGKNDNL